MSALDPTIVARLLRQRQEMGSGDLYLDGLTREEALGLATRRPVAAPDAGSRAPGGERTQRPHAPASLPGLDGATEDAATRSPTPVMDDADEGWLTTLQAAGYDEVRALAGSCRRCRLAEGRSTVVFSDGSPEGRVMVVGEAPGAQEDRTGLPFVGPAGKLLDLLLASVGLSRMESVYICNVIKCRPPGNRNPMSDEITRCSPFLRRQIELVRPEAILAVGTFSGQLLTGETSALGKLRGRVYSYQGVPLVVTYHPAALLRNAGWTRATWDDFQLLRQILDEG